MLGQGDNALCLHAPASSLPLLFLTFIYFRLKSSSIAQNVSVRTKETMKGRDVWGQENGRWPSWTKYEEKHTHTQALFLLFHAYAGLFKDVQYMGVKMSWWPLSNLMTCVHFEGVKQGGVFLVLVFCFTHHGSCLCVIVNNTKYSYVFLCFHLLSLFLCFVSPS